jgi:uncharacterized repeat protein (TIGR01451 family)
VFATTPQSYLISVTNKGPGNATGVTIVDTLPAGATFLPALSHPACVNNAGTVTCTLGPGLSNLAAGASFQIQIGASFPRAGTYANTAKVFANEPDPDQSNNTSIATTAVLPTADLAVAVTASPDPVGVGLNVTYSIATTNNGPDPAPDVFVIDTIPVGTTFVSIASPQASFCGQNGTAPREYGCRFLTGIPVGGTRGMTIVVTAPLSAQTLSNEVRAGHVFTAGSFIADIGPGPEHVFTPTTVVGVFVSQPVPAGGSLTAGSAATTPADAVQTTVTSPFGGTIAIIERPNSGTPPPSWTFVGLEVIISAPAGSTGNPIKIVFRIDAAAIPAGQSAATIQVFRNNATSPIAACTQTSPTISPDPCVVSRATLSDGDAEITVLTSKASLWTFAIERGDDGQRGPDDGHRGQHGRDQHRQAGDHKSEHRERD